MDAKVVTTSAIYLSIDDIHAVLKSALDEAMDVVRYEAGADGWLAALIAAGNPIDIDINVREDIIEKKIRDVMHIMGQLRPDYRNDDLTVLATQLHQLYSIYFTGRSQLWRDSDPKAIINALARKVNKVESGYLWPDGSWVSTFHKPNPSWLSEHEYSSVVGDIDYAVEYKKMLRRLGYAPARAPSIEALDSIWQALYDANPYESKPANASSYMSPLLVSMISPSDKYAVVSYVQCANGRKPPASWTSEVDSVLTGLVQLGIIPEKAVWFDKLASRQYKDSQKWWGAAATMQFLFNPTIVVLPRMSELSLFTETIGPCIWGSDEAADGMYADFQGHAQNCKECQSSFALRWALQQDHVIPIASLRTWPRVEHALGASGLGLFASEATYSALVACLTCAFAMFGALLKNDRALYHALRAEATPLPSTYIREDGSIIVGGWVVVSCSNWHCSRNKVPSMASLKDMTSSLMELHQLYCQLHIPTLLALGRTPYNPSNVLAYETVRLCESPGLFYLKGERDVDVPMLARLNTNATYALDLSEGDLPEDIVVRLYHHWALLEIHKNRPQEDQISISSFVAARQKALSTLVHTKAAEAPCFSWSDKLVAAILLSLPNIFAEAVTFWNNGSDWLTRLSSLVLSEAGITDPQEADQHIEWEPNSLIVALAMLDRKHDLHRLVPRPPGLHLSSDRPVNVQPFEGDDDVQSKRFAAFFLGHLPPRSWEAVCFHTTTNKSLPRVREWMHKMLQDGALCITNVVVVRSTLGENQETTHCFHCQKHRRTGKESTDVGLVVDFASLQEFVDDLCDGKADECKTSVIWGLGSFDPLNLAAISDDDYYFGEHPDTVAVLLKCHRSAGNLSAWNFRAHALSHFCILGSKETQKCTACHAIIIVDKNQGHTISLWTILPMLSYKERYKVLLEME